MAVSSITAVFSLFRVNFKLARRLLKGVMGGSFALYLKWLARVPIRSKRVSGPRAGDLQTRLHGGTKAREEAAPLSVV